MDYFIKQNDFRKAALTAHEVLLQEDSENELTLAASLFSCMKYFQEYGVSEQPQPEPETDEKKVLKFYSKKF